MRSRRGGRRKRWPVGVHVHSACSHKAAPSAQTSAARPSHVATTPALPDGGNGWCAAGAATQVVLDSSALAVSAVDSGTAVGLELMPAMHDVADAAAVAVCACWPAAVAADDDG